MLQERNFNNALVDLGRRWHGEKKGYAEGFLGIYNERLNFVGSVKEFYKAAQ